ncbi:uncharacterized protein CTHT_0041540 [Thermochaetoides thermophila DSM 1495]|uniref:C2H2-type domain-containing protein n=1 Tax=Chaetomium thermophilum (strain DSM 1495 / CBS 144.50 / IMI 039719) TaxID=759272 RepID=G0SAA3_CHATD|nr:hypothetical protein CTHT_0041540 [Thermochaetoides thermophila DSM 1495]EGS19675.1 hypothetical protein CTHT_0041540 [Thermochaetoides thermophila DSM 1495]
MHHRAKRPAFQCPRCRSQLANVAALEQHLLMPREQMCEVNAEEPVFDREDGITEELAALLSGKDSKNEVWTWETICQVLFPGDPLMDTVELFEIDQIFDDTQDTLKSNLREKLRMLLPPNIIDDEYCSFLSTQLDLVFETHRANIVRRCLAYATGNKDTGVGSERTSEQRNGRRMSVKKPARISRRSTLMQSIQHHTTGNKHTRTLSLKPTVGTGVRECGHWRKTSNALPVNTSYVPMGAVKTNTTTNETPLTKDTNDNDNQTHISEIEPGSREQRDSGISIPNSSHSPQGSMLPDESDNSEPPTPSSCPSTSTDISDAQDTDTQQPAQPLPNPTSTLSKRLKPRPGRLNLNVGVGLGLGLGIDIPLTPSTILANQFESISAGGAGHATDRKGSNERGYLGECLTAPLPIDSPRGRNAEDGECHGGLFSPESFKQRVLRGRMSGVLGG